ncbi:MAG: LytR C-terminal domain-containing protein [SAR324 cluster bacterium]|nr:LytR C-terminal domain-containing protein [SAR324 cluster bacterium]
MKHWLIYIHGGFFALILWAAPLYAQPLIDGHILEQIDIASGDDDKFLIIRGILSPKLLSSVQLLQEDPLHPTIVIPNGMTNNLILPEVTSFKPGDIIEKVGIEEEIQEDGRGNLRFRSNLHLTSRLPIVLSLDKSRTTAGQMVFLILEKGGAGQIAAEDTSINGMPSLPLLSDNAEMPKQPGMSKMEMKEPDKMLLHPISAMMVFRRPSVLNLSILNASPRKEAAQRLAILLDRHQRKFLEDRLDMRLHISNISSIREQMTLSKTKIYFRPNYLTTALALATVIPGEQVVEEMSLERRGRLGLDVEIYVGANFE